MTVSARPINPQMVVDWVRLAATGGIGPVAFHSLLARTGSAAEALRQLPEIAQKSGRRIPLRLQPADDAAAMIEAASRQGIKPLLSIDPGYPSGLAALDDAPPILWFKGDIGACTEPCVAIVGARNASLSGRKLAGILAGDLAQVGMTVVSGLARGIDGAAHDGAVAKGKTVAVMAGGVDAIYPPEHRLLWQKITEAGAIVSELPPGTEPIAPLFPRRNRIISGLSLAVIVVEATVKSGSLITARYALDQGREVLAVPGSPLEPRSEGPNSLIRDGATLVRSAADVLAALGPVDNIQRNPAPQGNQVFENYNENDINPVRDRILTLIGPDPVAVDELIRQCQTSAPVMAQALLELELAGQVVRLPGNRVASRPPG